MDVRGGHAHNRARHDRGFTVVEILMIVVIFGILSTVAVFAVRGITDPGGPKSCDDELSELTRAQEVHLEREGSYADEANLLASNTIESDSAMYEVSLTPGGGYSIEPAADSECTISATGSGDTSSESHAIATAPGDYTPLTLNAAYASIPAHQLPQPQGGPTDEADEIVVLGRSDATADFNAAIADGIATSRRVTFISLDNFFTEAEVRRVLERADNNGMTELVIYAPDDTTSITRTSGGTWDSVTALVTDAETQLDYPDLTPRSFAAGSDSLTELFATYP